MQIYTPNYLDYNKDVINDLNDISKEIDSETEKDEIDQDKLLKLRLKRLYRGMELNAGYAGINYRAMIPY